MVRRQSERMPWHERAAREIGLVYAADCPPRRNQTEAHVSARHEGIVGNVTFGVSGSLWARGEPAKHHYAILEAGRSSKATIFRDGTVVCDRPNRSYSPSFLKLAIKTHALLVKHAPESTRSTNLY